MKTERPFIYIAGLQRTCSTLLQELLTEKGKCFFFHEPWFGTGLFENHKTSIKMLDEWGLSGEVLLDPNVSLPIMFLRLSKVIPQIGIKEIRHQGWEMYLNLFDDIRWIVLVREPRDIYVSSHYFLQRTDVWKPRFPPFSPKGLFQELQPDIERQVEIYRTQPHSIRIRYEDFAVDQENIWNARRFAGSEVATADSVGSFHKRIGRGNYETELHGGVITGKQINRWERETDIELISNFNEFYELMKDYREYWNY